MAHSRSRSIYSRRLRCARPCGIPSLRRSSIRRPLANTKFGRNLDETFANTNRLRLEGTDALLAAAREAGGPRFVAHSYAPYRYAREGGPVKTEEDPLDPTPPANTQETYGAMTYLEQKVTEFGRIALRDGGFYGAANDGLIEPVRKRQFPTDPSRTLPRAPSGGRGTHDPGESRGAEVSGASEL